ncbi:protease [Nesidiocoris tenuis]|uniref:Protease n=1 Tax=Nesidiocoris tenuis TaxID=355587 RepID=A0ABN7B742_9HEMI|nr:protease [Nesidiocoris tenuis]
MRNFLFLVIGVVHIVAGQDDDPCVCVDVWKCENGYITDPSVTARPKEHAGEGLIDSRIQTCEGIQICCPLSPGGGNGNNGGGNNNNNGGGNNNNGDGNNGNGDGNNGNGDGNNGVQLPAVAGLRGCGVRRLPPRGYPGQNAHRISGGSNSNTEDTFYGEAPWMARIVINNEFACGGSLVNPGVVLTGAHCIKGHSPNEISVEMGEWDTTREIETLPVQRRIAVKILTHPEFNDKNLQNDVALVFLAKSFDASEVVDTICMAESFNTIDVGSCVTIGWGKQDLGSKYPLQPILRKVAMPLMERDTCQSRLRLTRLGQHFKLLPGFTCGGGISEGDTCKGDGGGPLYCFMKDEPNRFAIVGITAWGIECGKGNPTVFASVPDYMPWISQTLNAEERFTRTGR